MILSTLIARQYLHYFREELSPHRINKYLISAIYAPKSELGILQARPLKSDQIRPDDLHKSLRVSRI